MAAIRRFLCVLGMALLFGGLVNSARAEDPVDPPAKTPTREELLKTLQDGNYKDAYEGLRKLALDPQAPAKLVSQDLTLGLQCLQNLNRSNELDEFREAVIKAHAKNWRLLQTAAQSYMNYEHYGFIVAGEFQRGQHRGGDGRLVNTNERDRIRALQLMQEALPLVVDEPDRNEASQFYLTLSEMLLNNRSHAEAWRLQYLSDLSKLPDYEDGYGYYGGGGQGAPVDADGNPVFHHTVKKWEAAETDGQRWRWALNQVAEASPARLNEMRMHFANFLHAQFGVQTMAQYGYYFGRGPVVEEEGKKNESGTYALDSLTEEETIARLASGIKRFPLPEEFNYIKIYRQVADGDTGYGDQGTTQLAQIFENRRQYPKAAEIWKAAIAKYGDAGWRKQRLDQIIGNWGRFETNLVQPSGIGATIDFRFRNGTKLSLEAHEIDYQKLLADVKAYLKSNPAQLDWQKMDISNLGYRLVQENGEKYIGLRAAKWDMKLEPAQNHFDRRVTIATPLQTPGAYMLTASMADGNVSKIIVWISDTAIVKKPMQGKSMIYVADAVTGKPLPKANVEFFGYEQKHVKDNKYRVDIKQFAEFTDADGLVYHDANEDNQRCQWLITATTDKGRFAYLGFTNVWNAGYYDEEYNQTKVFAITDRPVYRPGQKVSYKFWIGQAKYDQEGKSPYAGQQFQIQLNDPKGTTSNIADLKADEYGGVSGELELPKDATLGSYGIVVVNYGAGTFRVEEYKKPEFEVTVDAPKEPVKLGETIEATIKAKYYFGSPVTKAKVKYKVLRSSYSNDWFPYAPWDWLYGRGYWWFSYDYNWYPGFRKWGCFAPWPWWFYRASPPPELVSEAETEIGADGTVKVTIDTALAKEIHGDQDHSYQIEAEVVDESRRTIIGSGKVLAAREPFKVFAWVDRGYFRTGDVIAAQFSARTLDDKPVQGQGELTLFRVGYDTKGKPRETAVRTWPLATDDQGLAKMQIKASVKGQYRLGYKVTDSKQHTIEGGYVFTIIGDGFDGAEFRFNDLELIADKQDYAPGETVKLQVNTNRLNGTVLLFVRPANGVYLPPQVLRLTGKSQIVDIGVVKKDMPNFFIEAVTVAGAKVYNEVREIHVPPEKRVMNVEVVSSAESYKPGQKAKVTVKMTDLEGRAFIGSTVLAIYDKSVEYISGGSNVPEIKEFFWKWRRSHSTNQETSLSLYFGNMTLPNMLGMGDLGVFGASVAEEKAEAEQTLEDGEGGGGGLGGSDRFKDAPRGSVMEAAAAPAAAMAPGKPGANALRADIAGAAPGNDADAASGDPAAPAPAQLVEATVRSNFADTALWKASLTTNSDGLAEVELDMPENLTTWKIKAWGMGDGTRVGQGETEVVTRKDLIVRLQAPRFFVQTDEVVLSANVHNYLKADKAVSVELELDGPTLKSLDDLKQQTTVKANDEQRIDWRVSVLDEGEATIRMKALTDEESDAMEMKFPVYIHGMLKMDSFSGAIRPEKDAGSFEIRVPEERRPADSRLEVRYSPTLAGAMVDALPYLIDYPYGCTEQTLNRFLPAVITQKILLEMGLDLEAIQKKRTNLNAQEIGDDVERAKGWKRFDANPVFDKQELDKVVKAGVQKLTEMQLSDGGWGWFSGFGEQSYPHTTAVVVHGLQTAQHNDVALVPGMLDRGVQWLENYQAEQIRRLKNVDKDGKVIDDKKPYKHQADDLDAFVNMVLVDAQKNDGEMRDFLYRDRTKLSVYALAMYGMSLHKQGEKEKLDMVMKNIGQFVVQDDENQTAYLNLPAGFWWYWYGSEYEAHAYYLKLLSLTDPKSETASRLVKYLLNNRKHATYWNSTRDTALVVEAMADYLKASGENKPDMTVEVWLDGEKKQEVKITAADLFTFDNKFVLTGADVTTGMHKLQLKKQGTGPLYWNGYLTTFTLEEMIPKAGLEIKVQRKVYKLNKVDKQIKVAGSRGQAVDQKVEKYEREELDNMAMLTSGDLVEVELEIDSKNDYEYILFEDMKAAGFEAVEVRSGYNGNDLNAYVEFRDNRVAFFARTLARGKHSVSYRLRAEIPGKFSALPARAAAMYAPELKGNSDEIKLRIEDVKK